MDIISAALTSINNAIEIAKHLKTASKIYEKAEDKMKFADLINILAETKVQVADAKIALLSREEEIKELKKKIEVKENLSWEPPYYFLKSETGKVGPYCQACYDGQTKLSRLQNYNNGAWVCAVCSKTFIDSTYAVSHEPRLNDNWDQLENS